MSTDHQQYSIANQSAAIALYAATQNIGIVRSFIDQGRSGRTIKHRTGLLELLCLVESGHADFELILVYDVSRWGRFADSDESAHYEYVCKQAGVKVIYCAEQFENDNSMASNLLKAVKRTMAAEHSRELSIKVRTGKCRLAQQGYWIAGAAPFGLNRLLLDQDGKPRQIMLHGQTKSLQTDRTILVPGNQQDVGVVRRIFDLFTKKARTVSQIVRSLNADGLCFHGHPWLPVNIDALLENPAYVGTNVFGRSGLAKDGRSRNNLEKRLVAREGAFQPIIELEQFRAAQRIIATRRKGYTQQEMLDALRKLWKEKGTLNSRLIEEAEGVPSTITFCRHFGGIVPAFRLIGFKHKKNNFDGQSLKGIRRDILQNICSQIQEAGANVKRGPSKSILINDGITARMMLCRSRLSASGQKVWPLYLTGKFIADVLIVVRLNATSRSIVDYFVIPIGAGMRGVHYTCARNNPAFLELYRMDSLKPMVAALQRLQLPVAA